MKELPLRVDKGTSKSWGDLGQALFRSRELIFFQPLDQQERTVPHLKDLINIRWEKESQGHGMTFNLIYDRSKYPHFISYRGLC